VLLLIWVFDGFSVWILLPLLSLPWAASLIRTVWKSAIDSSLNILLAQTAALSFVYSFLLSIGFIVT
jgi:1,4-dihydroxy-2-naphthoate octaprenyltransferase